MRRKRKTYYTETCLDLESQPATELGNISCINRALLLLNYHTTTSEEAFNKSTMEDRVDSVDRISELPEPIMHHILSFLPMKQVFRCTLLSKTWNHACSTFPVLEFDRDFFENVLSTSYLKKKQKASSKKGFFLNFVEQALLSRRKQMISINKFSLQLFADLELESHVKRWIGYAVESNVQELKLVVQVRVFKPLYHLPQTVLAAKSITKLELGDCKLELPNSDIKLPSLKEFTLQSGYADEQTIKNLLVRCPSIEYLVLRYCKGFKSLKIAGLPKLKKLEVGGPPELERVEIEALNLSVFCLTTINEPCKINVAPCKNIHTLYLVKVHISDERLHHLLSTLPLLETLHLTFCRMLQRVEISSRLLKSLEFFKCDRLVAVDVDAPQLVKFNYFSPLISLSSKPLTLLEAKICFSDTCSDTLWYKKQIDFLAKFNSSKLVRITFESMTGKNLIIPKELRETLPPPLYYIKHLKLKFIRCVENEPIVNVMDTLLWISPHLETLYVVWAFSLKFVYHDQKLINRGENMCCRSLPILCWRYCLKEVKFESLREAKNEEAENEEKLIKKYFLMNAENLEKI